MYSVTCVEIDTSEIQKSRKQEPLENTDAALVRSLGKLDCTPGQVLPRRKDLPLPGFLAD